VHGRAAVLYGRALESFGGELKKVDASIASIQQGKFLQALVREEIRHDKEWVIRLRSLPESPETYYLMTLLAAHDFQTALQNYLDLEDLRKRMVAWQRGFDAFEDLIELRRKNYEPLLPTVDAQFRELDAQIRLRTEQRDHLDKRLQGLLIAPRPALLATTDQRIALEQIRALEAQLGTDNGAEALAYRHRIERLKGVLVWTLHTQYHEKLTEAHIHLNELNQVIEHMLAQHTAFVRARQAAVHSFMGYELALNRLRTRVSEGLENVNRLMAQQGHLIETVAINELKSRRERLLGYQTYARYAVADSYDRASKAPLSGGGE
jgi:hypothetical protein